MTRSLRTLHVRLRWPAARRPVRPGVLRDRGDVPGWVLITVMTAGIVSALWLFAGPALVDLFSKAISGVTGK